ncbi:MAG: hypothetical protein CL484_10040 [Acidobacteria bacterium]|nr:hypothetical protein [Acidobacteriota bacterium]
MKVLIACEYSGTVRDAFIAKGHNAISSDLIESSTAAGAHFMGDVLELINDCSYEFDMMIAFPPCTHLAVPGARWFKEKRADGRQQEAIEFVRDLWEAPIGKVCIETPVGVINRSLPHLPKPQYVQPWQFGHDEQKKTGLWTRGLPPLQPTNILQPPYKQSTWLMGPSPDRGHKRSLTFTGIAEAMASQWGEL